MNKDIEHTKDLTLNDLWFQRAVAKRMGLTLLLEPTQVFFYSPVKYTKQGLDRMLVGVRARKLGMDHLPLPPIGVPDPVTLNQWNELIHRPGRNEFITWAAKARKEGFWEDVDMRPM